MGPETASSEQTERLVRLWRDVHREDQEMCERLQQGRASVVAAGGGVLSPVREDSVCTFQGLVVGSLRWRDVHCEDHETCERLQQGRASDVAIGGGVLSPVREDSVRTFQDLVAGSLR